MLHVAVFAVAIHPTTLGMGTAMPTNSAFTVAVHRGDGRLRPIRKGGHVHARLCCDGSDITIFSHRNSPGYCRRGCIRRDTDPHPR